MYPELRSSNIFKSIPRPNFLNVSSDREAIMSHVMRGVSVYVCVYSGGCCGYFLSSSLVSHHVERKGLCVYRSLLRMPISVVVL